MTPRPLPGAPVPAGALDAAPRWLARDQTGGLARTYVDATAKYLRNAGLPDEDLDVIGRILDKYVGEPAAADAENLEMAPEKQIRVGGPRGPVGATDRLLAADRQLPEAHRRLLPRPVSERDRADFASRFPDADRIRTII